MGWNKLEYQIDCPLLHNLGEEAYVYFVHSYQAVVAPEYLAAYVTYGGQIPAMVYDGKTVFGAQFHPERAGNRLADFKKLWRIAEMIILPAIDIQDGTCVRLVKATLQLLTKLRKITEKQLPDL